MMKGQMDTRIFSHPSGNRVDHSPSQPDPQLPRETFGWQAITDKQWRAIESRLPKTSRSGREKTSTLDDRRYFEGALWVLWNGAPWSKLPECYGSKHTVQRRLSQWAATGVLLDLWRSYLDQIDDYQRAKWDECFIDGIFITYREGVNWEGRLRQAREQSVWYRPMAWVLRSEYTWKGNTRQAKSGAP
jgi:transposase